MQCIFSNRSCLIYLAIEQMLLLQASRSHKRTMPAVSRTPLNGKPYLTLLSDMARLAWECKDKLEVLVKGLEVELGPDTADLEMRFGLHVRISWQSGPVTAGILKGDRARFQLFGTFYLAV